MFPAKVLLALVSLGLVCALPSPSFRVHEKRDAVPARFTAIGPAPADQSLTLRLALAHADASGIIDTLYSVSDPASAQYGKHLTKAEVSGLLPPLPIQPPWLCCCDSTGI